MKLDFASIANAAYVERLYQEYQRNPSSVDPEWAVFFAGFELAGRQPPAATAVEPTTGVFDLIHSYRELGHFVAELDPLGHNQREHPLLELSEFGFGPDDLDRVVECATFRYCRQASLRELVELLRATYCRTLGVEYMHIPVKAQREWLQDRMEPVLNDPQLTPEHKLLVLDRLIAAEGFERFLQVKYVGQKRFSIEGGEALIPLLDTIVEDLGAVGTEEIIFAMAHRGRLNVLANILGKPFEMIFAEFEGSFLPPYVQGDGDVKYHLGYARDYRTRNGNTVHLSLLANPSHLEAIDPVALGLVKAKQQHRGDADGTRVVPVLIHGDAAFTGQGVVPETLALSELKRYATGGTIHIIINNQIGFTTSPEDYRFTRYPSDLARFVEVPVFHVNADDPEAAIQAGRLAAAFRHTFRQDVIIDLVCYRRHGHNETDDPTFTHPVLYREIEKHPTVTQLYGQRLMKEGVLTQGRLEEMEAGWRELFENALNYARDFMPKQQVFAFGGLWEGLGPAGDDWSAETAVDFATLRRIVEGVRRLPPDFTPHPRVAKLLEERDRMVQPEGKVDWACAEMLAFGSLLLEGTPVRLSGQDSGRGTFSQRHAAIYDYKNGSRYVPLDHLSPTQGRFTIIDSMLSEYAVLGFEYGFSTADPRNLVLWEAQFGDFANGAQIAIDQFIVSAESKWQRQSGLVLLLPHGYEGQGPEHSSARLERFLQLCAENNIQVCYPTTPAQYFHVLRRQMLRKFRKPLVLMTPKSLLRHRLAVSPVEDFTSGGFREVIGEETADPKRVRRVCLCSGKVYYDLLVARSDRGLEDVALVRLEQFYPFPEKALRAELARFQPTAEIYWVQEEPFNMGGRSFVAERIGPLLEGRPLWYAGRDEAASPATGSYKVHQAEQEEVVERALGRGAWRLM